MTEFVAHRSRRGAAGTAALISGVSILLLGLLLLANRSRELQATERKALNEALTLTRGALELKFRSADFNGWQTAYAFDAVRGAPGATEELGRSRQLFLRSTHAFEQGLVRVAQLPLSVDERSSLDRARTLMISFMAYDVKIIEGYRSRDPARVAQANEWIMGIEIDLFQSIADATDRLARSVETRAHETLVDADRKQRVMRMWFLGSGVGALIFMLLLVWFLLRFARANLALLTQLHDQASSDALTGLANRRQWDERLPTEISRSGRLGYPVSVAVLDLDWFKQFNDQNGHPEGDRLLQGAAMAWRAALRDGDLLARIGGEEFGVLLPGCDAVQATALIDRLRPLTPAEQTFSAGIAVWANGESSSALVARADQAVYKAKADGRARTCVAVSEEVKPAVIASRRDAPTEPPSFPRAME